MILTRKFVNALKVSEIPAWEHAVAVGLRPDTLSKYVKGWYVPSPPHADRIAMIGERLGLKRCDIFCGEQFTNKLGTTTTRIHKHDEKTE